MSFSAELEKPTSTPINCMSHIQIHTCKFEIAVSRETQFQKITRKKRKFQLLHGNVIRMSAHENISKQDESDTYIIDSEMQTNKKNQRNMTLNDRFFLNKKKKKIQLKFGFDFEFNI